MKTDPKQEAKLETLKRLEQLSDKALEEAADLVDDIMVIFHQKDCLEEAGMFQAILVDLVMEQERRDPESKV